MAANRAFLEFEINCVPAGDHPEHLQGFADDFGTDTVTFED
jgi:hypothetical protein